MTAILLMLSGKPAVCQEMVPLSTDSKAASGLESIAFFMLAMTAGISIC